jgi:riboflavin synthase
VFTGIIEELGVVEGMQDQGDAVRLTVRGPQVTVDAGLGDSIAVNGCCLTVAQRDGATFTADVMRETLDKTALGALERGARVNLERAVTAATRLGGHIVQGHVDGVGELVERREEGIGLWLRFRAPEVVQRYLIEKGSVTVAGVSLTIAELHDDGFAVAIVPHTLQVTTFGRLAVGDPVNLEADMIARYVERLLTASTAPRC